VSDLDDESDKSELFLEVMEELRDFSDQEDEMILKMTLI